MDNPISSQIFDSSMFSYISNLPDFEDYLPPTKIKRQYKCSACNHVTFNPRVHLRHRNNSHGLKLKIVECPLCMYACQYRQKLNRHLRLVHHCSANQIHREPPSTSQNIKTDFAYGIDHVDTGVNQNDSPETEQPLDLSFPPRVKEMIRNMERIQCNSFV